MEPKAADDRSGVRTLRNESAKVVYRHFVRDNGAFDFTGLPDPITFRIIQQGFITECRSGRRSNYEWLWKLCKGMHFVIWARLLKYESYRPTMMQFYQKLIDNKFPVGQIICNSYRKMCADPSNLECPAFIMKLIKDGLTLGTFLSEASWYVESERILTEAKNLTHRLPKGIPTYKISLECYHRLFHTLTMYFKFDDAARLVEKILNLLNVLKKCGINENRALLYTEFSRFSYFRNNYEESYKWITHAVHCLHEKLPLSVQVQVLRQASKVCVVMRDFTRAKFLIYQALARAEQYYGSGYYKLAGVLLDFGFYLLNSDNIEQSVKVYQKAYDLRTKMFGSEINNLHIAIAQEDLAYALYVQEYSSGLFDVAMKHAEQAIITMKKLLSNGNLMLCSANRVKALILEEQALDNFQSSDLTEINRMLKEAEKLHRDALTLTKDTFGEENILTAKHYGNLGRLYQSMGKHKDAENMHLKAIKIKEKILGPEDYEVGLSVGHLASLYNYHMYEYKKAEELYHRSININLRLFSESYSGLEYDYRGLIHVYEKLHDDEMCMKFKIKLHKWHALRKKSNSDLMGSDFYKIINLVPTHEIIAKFDTSSPTTAEIGA